MCAIAEVVKCTIRLSPIGNKLSHYGTSAGIVITLMTALSTEAGTLAKIREHAADVVRAASKNFREHSRKTGGGLETIGSRIVAKASMNTCKHWLEHCKQTL